MPYTKLKGRKLMLVNVIYVGPSKKKNWTDYIVTVYRDLILDKKEIFIIENPEIDIFIVKPEYRTFKKARHFLPNHKLEKKTVKYKNVLREIAKIAGPSYVEYYNTHTKKENKNMFKYPYVLGADINIETYYRVLWAETFGQDITNCILTRGFFDIEVDQYYYQGSMAKHGECPVNAISMVDRSTKTVHEFLLYEPSNPLIDDFLNRIDEFIAECHRNFDDSYGADFQYKIYMLKDERELLIQAFALLRTILSPDFLGSWNGFGFDYNYLIHRARVLGIDPTILFCDEDFPDKQFYFYDDIHSFEFANKRSYFNATSKIHHTDMMIDYPSLRKTKGTIKRVNLGYVAKNEIKDTKLDYSDSGNIRTLPYENYWKFVMYSIKDSLLLYGIDNKTKDFDNIYLIAMTNYVPYKDTLKQTVVFRALLFGYLRSLNMTLGHNVNFDVDSGGKYDENGERISLDDEEEEDDSFEGVICAAY